MVQRINQGRFRSRGCDTAEGRGYQRRLLENIQADSQGWTSVESQEGPPCLRGDSFQQAKAVAQTLASPCQESARDTGPGKYHLVDGFRLRRFARPCGRCTESCAFHTGIPLDSVHGGNHLGERQADQHSLR